MPAPERQTFPLVPRRRLAGLPFGDLPSRRRGHGSDVIGSRRYEPGDPVSTIDWYASARLSATTGGDEFVVRARAADEAPRVAIVADLRPSMGLYPAPLPWLSKRAALREAAVSIAVSAVAVRADLAALDFAGAEPSWLPPGRRDRAWLVLERYDEGVAFDAPEDTVELAFDFLSRHRTDLPAGSFVFVLSDFLASTPPETWLHALGQAWDVVPVVIQDPIWERSFPDVGSVGVPVVDPRTGRGQLVRLSRRETARRRASNEHRFAALLDELASFGLTPVVVDSSDPFAVDRAFLEWAEERKRSRWAR